MNAVPRASKTQVAARPWALCRTRGIVSIESLLVLVPVLLAFLGVVQLALIGFAVVVVQHAAARAARAAIVVLEDDPEHYGGAARGSLVEGTPKAPAPLLSAAAPSVAAAEEPPSGGARLAAIRQAAYAPLAVLSPPPERLLGLTGQDLRSAFSGSLAARVATGLFVTGPALAAIRLTNPTPGDAPSEQPSLTEVGTYAEFSVSVDYLFPCLVPWVRSLVCRSGLALARAERERRSEDEHPEVERPRLRKLLLRGGHYFPIHASVTALSQGARYHQEQE